MANAGWFNDTKYSDLTLKLSDDREINVHKFVICNNNKYFDALCGEGSKFAESSKKLIVLEGDDPDAVEELLRKLYGCTLPAPTRKTWRFWFNLALTADKYMEPTLARDAYLRFEVTAEKEKESDAVFEILETIRVEASGLEKPTKLAEKLRKDNLNILLDNEKFRAHLDGDKALMWEQLDELKKKAFSKVGEEPPLLAPKNHFLCGVHHRAIIGRFANSTQEGPEGSCTVCKPGQRKAGYACVLWVAK